jgi:hypothetical protein
MKVTTSRIRSDIGLAVKPRIAISRLARRLRELGAQERSVLRAAAPVLEKLSPS